MAGLYIHIPFCHSKCAYCDFFSTPRHVDTEAYIDAVINEWHHRRDALDETIETIYIGGGTPSILPVKVLDRLIASLPVNVTEFTIEANPEDVTDEWCHYIASTPVNRVSMGIQSFNDAELQTVGRRHTAGDALKAIDRLRSAGITELSCDLIYGLPGQTVESWQQSLDRLIELKPPHLSCYLLSYEEGTRLWAMRETGKIVEASEELAIEMYNHLIETTRHAGYVHYEISNFALPGHHARHNSSYWLDKPYIGLGVSAHSFDGRNRSFNPPSIKDYISRNGIGTAIIEEETPDERLNDYIITSLRTARGLHLDEATERFGKTAADHITTTSRPHIKRGNMALHDNTLTIPESQWLVSDRIMTDLMKV